MKEELKKMFRGKLILGLILLSVMINTYLLLMYKDKTDMLGMLDQFCMENGSVVSDESMEIFAEIWDEKKAADITWEEFENNIKIAAGYYNSIKSRDMADIYCGLKRLSGEAAEYVRSEFQKLDEAISKASEQELTFFLPFRMYAFDFISAYFLFTMNLEGIVVAVIVTLYCVDMERSNHTVSTVYSTRKGKKIIKDKLFASVISSLACFCIIAGATLLLAGCIFPLKTILNTYVSNPFVNLRGVPCMTKETMTLGNYIFLSLGISCILTIIYSMGSFCLGLRAKNGYYAFGFLVVLLGIMKVISTAAPTFTCMYFWTRYNPLDLALKAGTWFLYGANQFSPSGYEGATAVLWLAVCAVGCICGLRSMERRREKL